MIKTIDLGYAKVGAVLISSTPTYTVQFSQHEVISIVASTDASRRFYCFRCELGCDQGSKEMCACMKAVHLSRSHGQPLPEQPVDKFISIVDSLALVIENSVILSPYNQQLLSTARLTLNNLRGAYQPPMNGA